MTQEEKIRLLKDVEDLILQATVERSHNYTGSVLKRCRYLILESLDIEV
jgi:hypothetical protein